MSFAQCQWCVCAKWPQQCRASDGIPERAGLLLPLCCCSPEGHKGPRSLTGRAHLSASMDLPKVRQTLGPAHSKQPWCWSPCLKESQSLVTARLWASALINNNSLGSVCMCCFFCFRSMRSSAIDYFICDSCSSYLLGFPGLTKVKLYFINLWPTEKSPFLKMLSRCSIFLQISPWLYSWNSCPLLALEQVLLSSLRATHLMSDFLMLFNGTL